MKNRRLPLLFSLAVVAFGACAPRHPAATPNPPVAATTPPTNAAQPAAAPPTPLPEGWAWPFHPATPPNVAFTPMGIERPFDLSKVTALHQKAPKLSPFEAAPGVWITPIDKAFRFTPQKGTSSALKSSAKTPAPNPSTLPPAADLRALGLDGPIMNQQLVGVCWTFAVSNTMSNALRRSGRTDVIAPLHILASTTWDDLWDGKAGPSLVTEPQWTYDPVKACKLDDRPDSCSQAYHVQAQSWQSDPELVAEKTSADANGALQATHATTFDTDDSTHLADRIAGAVANGQSVYVGMDIDLDLWSNGVKGGHIPDWTNGDSGHAVTIVGYRPATNGRDFLVHNSWGTSWGDQGYAWLSETMLTKYTHEAFVIDAVQSTKGAPIPSPKTPSPNTLPLPLPIPTPTPTPVPTGNGCGQGQVRDLVFGMCASPCNDGNPPTAGLCAPTMMKTPGLPASKCPAGQVQDWVTGQCSAQCKSGLPPAAGLCAP